MMRMRKSGAVASAVACLAAAEGATMAQMQSTTLDFTLQANLIVISVSVNGTPCRFLLDTGAGGTVIDQKIVSDLGLKEADKSVGYGAGGEVQMSLVTVDHLQVGDLDVERMVCVASDLTALGERLGGHLDGILGFNFFGSGRLVVDYPAKRVTIERAEKEQPDTPKVEGDRLVDGANGIVVERPSAAWSFAAETRHPRIVAELDRAEPEARIEVQVAEVHGWNVDLAVRTIEPNLAARIESLEWVSRGEVTIDGRPGRVLDYRGEADGKAWRFRTAVTVAGTRVVIVTWRASEGDFAGLEGEFDSVLAGLRVEEGK